MDDLYDYANSSSSQFTADPPQTYEQFLQLSQMASTFAGRISSIESVYTRGSSVHGQIPRTVILGLGSGIIAKYVHTAGRARGCNQCNAF